MRILIRFLKLILLFVLFFLLLAFAIKNDELVRVQVFFDAAWDVPLIVVMFVSLIAGGVIGAGCFVPTILGLRRELGAAKEMQLRAPLPAASPTRLRGQFTDISDSF